MFQFARTSLAAICFGLCLPMAAFGQPAMLPSQAATGGYVAAPSLPEIQFHPVPPSLEPAWQPTPTRTVAWYSRFDYFHWKEKLDDVDFVNEEGLLLTLGYERRSGVERFRAELFGGSVDYQGGAQTPDGSVEPLDSYTNYLGLRGEYEFVFDPAAWPTTSLYAGLGSRFWFRDLPDSETASGTYVLGYQERWWTFYPYLGAETRRSLGNDLQCFANGRVGVTAFTHEFISDDGYTLHPRAGLMSQLEFGVRGSHVFASISGDVLTWNRSAIVRDSLQPASSLLLVGVRLGAEF